MEENIEQKNNSERKHGGDVLVVRSIVCIIILITTLFVRFNNQYIYDSIKFWYQENILEEKCDLRSVREGVKKVYYPIKTKVLDLFSNLTNK